MAKKKTKRGYTKLTPKQIEAAAIQQRRGVQLKDIAKDFGCHTTTVSRAIKQYEVSGKNGSAPRKPKHKKPARRIIEIMRRIEAHEKAISALRSEAQDILKGSL